METAHDPSTGNQDRISVLSLNILQEFDRIFGLHPGFRPAHAKGMMVSGSFTPSAEAAALTRAPHAHRDATPVTVRFSNSTGLPTMPDNDPNGASPRGMATRFHLGEHEHTDLVAHSTDGFPTRTAEEFLEFLRAVAASGPEVPKPTPVELYVGSHPVTMQYVTTPKPIPTSFAKESFYLVSAFAFTNGDGARRYGRMRILPEAGNEYLNDAEAAAKTANFLFDELVERLAHGPIRFRVVIQMANDGDPVDDSGSRWPEDRPQVDFGTITLTEPVPEDDAEKRRIIYDPIPRVDGIAPSDDPLFEVRSAIYLMSGRRRRAAMKAAG